MEEKFININGIPTRIRVWGKSLDEKFDKNEKLIVFFCGNPGVSGFYILFLSTLFKLLQGQTSVWTISHAGHDEPDDETMEVPPFESNENLYDLNGQINHKIEFVRKYIPHDVKVYLVGHSIGAYIVLHLLKLNDINKRISHCYLLFPTIAYMADTPNGKSYLNVFRKWFALIYGFLQFFSYLPWIVRKSILSMLCWIRSFPQEFVPHMLMVGRPSVLSKVVRMADDEMEKVKAPDYDLMKQNEDRLTFFYSTLDEWAPPSYYEELIRNLPNVDAKSTDKFEHSFVAKASYEMGALLGEWIQQQNTMRALD